MYKQYWPIHWHMYFFYASGLNLFAHDWLEEFRQMTMSTFVTSISIPMNTFLLSEKKSVQKRPKTPREQSPSASQHNVSAIIEA